MEEIDIETARIEKLEQNMIDLQRAQREMQLQMKELKEMALILKSLVAAKVERKLGETIDDTLNPSFTTTKSTYVDELKLIRRESREDRNEKHEEDKNEAYQVFEEIPEHQIQNCSRVLSKVINHELDDDLLNVYHLFDEMPLKETKNYDEDLGVDQSISHISLDTSSIFHIVTDQGSILADLVFPEYVRFDELLYMNVEVKRMIIDLCISMMVTECYLHVFMKEGFIKRQTKIQPPPKPPPTHYYEVRNNAGGKCYKFKESCILVEYVDELSHINRYSVVWNSLCNASAISSTKVKILLHLPRFFDGYGSDVILVGWVGHWTITLMKDSMLKQQLDLIGNGVQVLAFRFQKPITRHIMISFVMGLKLWGFLHPCEIQQVPFGKMKGSALKKKLTAIVPILCSANSFNRDTTCVKYKFLLLVGNADFSSHHLEGNLVGEIYEKYTGGKREEGNLHELMQIDAKTTMPHINQNFELDVVQLLIICQDLQLLEYVDHAKYQAKISYFTEFQGYISRSNDIGVEVGIVLKSKSYCADTFLGQLDSHGMEFVVGMAVIGINILYATFYVWLWVDSPDGVKITNLPLLVVGFNFGASFVALHFQLCGGMYTRMAKVGVDLMMKLEQGILEDDSFSPVVTPNLIGDNVGRCAALGADMFKSIVAEIITAMILGGLMTQRGKIEGPRGFTWFPLVVSSFDLVISTVAIFSTHNIREPRVIGPMEDLMTILLMGYCVIIILAVLRFCLSTCWMICAEEVPSGLLNFALRGLIGIIQSRACWDHNREQNMWIDNIGFMLIVLVLGEMGEIFCGYLNAASDLEAMKHFLVQEVHSWKFEVVEMTGEES